MFKILTIGVLIYLLYRFVVVKKSINAPNADPKLKNKNPDEGEFVDYEEID